ncbi:hypothetical protein SASPL_144244 [Salvia splendens]|uniref:Uncharacterized protein n=1 Tax=Salvia splendens TaxID=180675 RepID=A0A8X8ZAT2_SALSN|nr:hypothetical protein SASPL_144244 [Salvia splendens]
MPGEGPRRSRSQSVPRPARDDPLSPREQLEQFAGSRRVRDWDPRAQSSEPILFPKLRIHFADLLSRFQGGQAIRTDGRSAWAHAQGFAATAMASYSSGPGSCPDSRVSAQLGTVTQLPVQPASPVLLTKSGPLGALDSLAQLNEATAPSYLFKNSHSSSSYPEGNFGGNQLLDGIVHHLLGPDRYAHSNPSQKVKGPGTTGLSPSPAPLSRGLEPGPSLRTLLQTTIRTAWPPDSQVGLFPVRSPLLRESL